MSHHNDISEMIWNFGEFLVKNGVVKNNPGGNNGVFFSNDFFTFNSYNWNEEDGDVDLTRETGFFCEDIFVSWYKHCKRGVFFSDNLTPDVLRNHLVNCAKTIVPSFDANDYVF